jgi:RND family efflux transporter MFP subunit
VEAADAKAGGTALVVPVQVVVAGEGSAGTDLVVTGTLDAIQQAPLTVKYGGIIKKLHVDVGDRVVAGQPLAMIDTDDRVQAMKQAEAGRSAAEVQVQTMEKEWKRFSVLQEGGTIPKADHEKIEMGYRAAKLQLQGAEAGVAIARNMLADAVLKAPFAGQVTARIAQLGGYVDPMMHPVMFVLVDASRLKVTMNVPEMRAGLIKAGDPVRVRVPASGREFDTKIEVLADALDPMTHARPAIAWLDNPGPDPVPSGSFFEARIAPSGLEGRILLPSSAVREDGKEGPAVFVVAEGKAALRPVKGRFLADRSDFVVESGVREGDLVVAEASMVRDGQAVEAIREQGQDQGQGKDPGQPRPGAAEAAR